MKVETRILLLILLNLEFFFCLAKMKKGDNRFYLTDKEFILNGKPFQMISGEMHYPRIPKDAWRDRFKMAKAMGLNTISMYIFWNVHQPEKDKFDFSGNNDIARFVQTAKEEGLYVILRPSPYVCAEWEFGGYPYWLQNEENLEVRSKNINYLTLYRNYIQKVADQISKFQINRNPDGNILMIQVENEYGSYGSDKEYLKINQEIFKNAGFDGVLFTCDPIDAIKNGHLEGMLPAINGQDDPETVFSLINQNNQGHGPYLIAEWYPAWFDSWGRPHNTKPADEYAEKLDKVLKNGISINMYMFHGGTTTGFRNGANFNLYDSGYEPQITSYDYDAPLDEAGNPTEKYFKFREVIKKYLPPGQKLPDVPKPKSVIQISSFQIEEEVDLLKNLNQFEKFLKGSVKIHNKNSSLPCFEDIKLDYGYVVYETQIYLTNKVNYMEISGIRDYAMVFVNGKKVVTYDRRLGNSDVGFYIAGLDDEQNVQPAQLSIIVENSGRINFGPELLKNRKGILGDVKLNGQNLDNWTTYKISLQSLLQIKSSSEIQKLHSKQNRLNVETDPIILRGHFDLESVGDTYLDLSNWGKGTVWINGNNLGRYWSVGPQQTLYLPREWVKEGRNDIVIFEMFKTDLENLKGTQKPILDKLGSDS